MSKTEQPTGNEQPRFTEANIANARKCFVRGQELAAKKNYDYAIQMYISGLEHWPEAVEEGHMPCRAAALFRGKTKIGFSDQMRLKTGGKDAHRAMLNAEMLLSKDPQNVGYMEALFKNAARAQFDQTVMWIGEIFFDAASKEAKPSPARFELMRKVYEELGDRTAETDPAMAIAAMDRAVAALDRLRAIKPNDLSLATELRDVAGKLTILKGQYSTADSFRDSVRDTDAQKELHDRERLFQSDERMDQLIAQARAEYEKNPTDRTNIQKLVDLLARRDNPKDEGRAIKILVKAYKDTGEYAHKRRASELRIRQLKRKVRELQEAGDRDAARQQYREQLEFELATYREWVKQYPTDLRIKYQYGMTLFRLGRYDDAIPVLQEARSDPKTRVQCSLYLGRAFHETDYHSQAADTFREAIELHETPQDDTGKKLYYWLGRSQEKDGQVAEALKTYGQLITWDYNYRDVRERINALKGRNAGESG